MQEPALLANRIWYGPGEPWGSVKAGRK